MSTISELGAMLCEEIEKVVDYGTINQGNLDIVYKLTSALKNVKKIEKYNDEYGLSYVPRSHESGNLEDKIQEALDSKPLSAEDKATVRRAMQLLNNSRR